MDINSSFLYSIISKNENLQDNDMEKVLAFMENCENSESADYIKTLLEENWKLKDDISNFQISKSSMLSTKTGKKYFNVTIKQDKKLYSYNFENE